MKRRDVVRYLSLLGLSAHSLASEVALNANAIHRASSTERFTHEQRTAIALLSELIIPTTDTPGAITAGVPAFIETIYAEWYTDNERQVITQGLTDLDTFCLQESGVSFNDCPQPIKIAALLEQEVRASQYQPPAQGSATPIEDQQAPFFTRIKELVVIGYYTSEIGAKEELRYLPMPMEYDGDYEFTRVNRQWSY